MGQKPPDGDRDEPSLELPSLGMRGLRRKRRAKAEQATQPEQVEPAAQPEPAEHPKPARQPREAPARSDDAPTLRQPVDVEDHAETGDGDGFVLPQLPHRVAAALTGLIVGVLGTLLTYGSLRGCEALRGTGTCGDPGFFLLVAILIVMILFGATLLKAWQVSDPTSTSFLAVGIVTVLLLLVLIEVLFSAWMFLVVPLVSALSYAGSHWVTTRFTEENRDVRR